MTTKNTAIVTGAGGDIGCATCLKLAEQGYAIACIDINPDSNGETVKRLSTMGATGTAITCDVMNSEQVTHTAEQANTFAQQLGGVVQVIVNNAGRATALNQSATDFPQWALEQNLNLNSVFLVIKAFENNIKKGDVRAIINVSSVNGLGVYGNTPYSVAKAGLIHYTKQLAIEYGKYQCRVNCVAPGTVKTQAWAERVKNNPQVWDEVTQWYALQRVAIPTDIANAIGFLASEQASAITGITLPVDCGLTAGVKKLADSFAQDDF